MAPSLLYRLLSVGGSFVHDAALNILCAGDMVSSYTLGFEGAVISAMEAAECVKSRINIGGKNVIKPVAHHSSDS